MPRRACSKRRGASPAGAASSNSTTADINIFADELAGFGPEVLGRLARPTPRGRARPPRANGGRPWLSRPAAKAQDKLAFLLSLVPYLMDHDRVSVTEAAKHFGVQEEQIRDAVRLIAVSGIPGETATYQHGDLFDIAWDDFEDNDQIVLTNLVAIDDSPRFSAREAAALIAGLQYLSALPENADRAAIALAHVEALPRSVGCPSPVAVEATETDEALGLIRRRSSRACRSSSTTSTRAASGSAARSTRSASSRSTPTGTCAGGATCARRCAHSASTDRLPRPITQEPITHGAEDVTLPETLFEGTADDLLVTIDVTPAALPLLADYIPAERRRASTTDRVRTTVRVSHFHGLKRLIAAAGRRDRRRAGEARAVVAEWAADRRGTVRRADMPWWGWMLIWAGSCSP